MANGKVRVKVNTRGVGALLRSDELRSDLTRRMARVLNAATNNAAKGEEYVLEQHTTDRAVVRVGSTSEGAFFMESKTGNLARSLDRAGGA